MSVCLSDQARSHPVDSVYVVSLPVPYVLICTVFTLRTTHSTAPLVLASVRGCHARCGAGIPESRMEREKRKAKRLQF